MNISKFMKKSKKSYYFIWGIVLAILLISFFGLKLTLNPSPPAGAVVYYEFDDSSSNVQDSAGTYTGINSGALQMLGIQGGALFFDAVNSYVQLSSIPTNIVGNFTMIMWVLPLANIVLNPEATSGQSGIAGGGQRYATNIAVGDSWWPGTNAAGAGLSVGANGISVYEHAVNYLPPLLTWSGKIDKWTHVAVVYFNNKPSLYIDGVLVKQGLQSLRNVHPGIYGFGKMVNYGNYYGSLDEVKVFPFVLSASEIMSDFSINKRQNTVAEYNFNSGGIDSGRFGNNLLIRGATLGRGISSAAWKYNGVNNYMSAPNSQSLGITDEITISAWVKPGKQPVYTCGSGIIVNKEMSYEIAIETGTNKIMWALSGPTSCINSPCDVWYWVKSSVVVKEGSWNYIVLTYKSSEKTGKLYLNGKLAQTFDLSSYNSASYGIIPSIHNLTVGARIFPPGKCAGVQGFFNGSIDEVKILNYALPENNILTEYIANAKPNQLVAYYSFENNLLDSSGNENTGVAWKYASTVNSVYTAGKSGNGVLFDGVSDRIQIEDSGSLDLTENMTFSVWWKTPSKVDRMFYFAGKAGSAVENLFAFGYNGANKKMFISAGELGMFLEGDAIDLAPNTWYHLAWSIRASKINYLMNGLDYISKTYFYINGVSAGSVDLYGLTRKNNDKPLQIGTFNSDSALGLLAGVLDEVKVWNYGLTDSQIRAEYITYSCGDGILQTGEVCDGVNLNGKTCLDLGYTGGTLSCNSSCGFNKNACTNYSLNWCSDSDGGIIISLKGMLNASGIIYNDNCENTYSGGNPLVEYFCTGNSMNLTRINCTDGCANGACLASPTTQTCNDSDAKNYYNQGRLINNSGTFYDTCYNSTNVIEYFCTGTSTMSENVYCAGGCSNGACLTPIFCSDSDGGINYTQQGTISNHTISLVDSCASSLLQEYYCNATEIKSQNYNCSNMGDNYVCRDGRCLIPGSGCLESCASHGYTCGTYSMCGTSINCGSCVEGNCVNGNCAVSECQETCENQGYECGSQTICGTLTDCGSCAEGNCIRGVCVVNSECSNTCSRLGYECGSQDICGEEAYCGGCTEGKECSNLGKCVAKKSSMGIVIVIIIILIILVVGLIIYFYVKRKPQPVIRNNMPPGNLGIRRPF